MTEDHERDKRPQAVKLLQELDTKIGTVLTNTEAASKKLDVQNGRLDRHSNEIVDMKLEVRELGTKIDNLPCDERISSCRRSFDAISDALGERKLDIRSGQQSRSTMFAAFAGAALTAGCALVVWVLSQWLG